jgi:DNA polymerase-3 subunit delta'
VARAPAVQEIEALPESDRLSGFPHPRHTVNLFGHEGAERGLAEAFQGGRMHHGWLIAGREGVGKATLAYRLARHVLAEAHERDPFAQTLAVADDATASRQVRALSHPGLLLLRRPWDAKSKRFTTTIPIDEVRRLRAFLGHRGAEDAWRVVLVDSADDLNTNAANALLKSLEEPPARTIFLLLTARPGDILPTIRSRCRLLHLEPLGSEPLRKAVRQALTASSEDVTDALPAPSEWPILERLAEGSVRRLLGLRGGGGLALYQRVYGLITALPKVDWAAVHTLSDELAGTAAEQRFMLFYDLLLGMLERLIRAGAGAGAGDTDEVALARRLMPEGSLATWAELWETLVQEKADAVLLNLDRKSLIMGSFIRLERAAKGATAA